MLKSRFLKLLTTELDDGRYSLSAQNEDGVNLPVSQWKNLVFSQHKESYFGTLLEEEKRENAEAVTLSGWQLVTLFAKESFNHFIEWDWGESAEICLASSHALYDGIVEKDWHPDFSAWEQGHFRWKLPEQVQTEFTPDFWDQQIPARREGAIASDLPSGESEDHHLLAQNRSVRNFISDLYENALGSYLTRNPAMKELFGPKLELLKKQNISGAELARYFDEESWLEWVGIKESPLPFTIGLKLEEPEDGEGPWNLDVFLRSKKNADDTFDLLDSKIPAKWRPFFEIVDREQTRWARLIPSLREDGKASAADGADTHGTLKTHLTEEEAWMFLTEASETLLALDVEILLPSWWQAMKNANLKVKASLKGSSSHRPSFVGFRRCSISTGAFR